MKINKQIEPDNLFVEIEDVLYGTIVTDEEEAVYMVCCKANVPKEPYLLNLATGVFVPCGAEWKVIQAAKAELNVVFPDHWLTRRVVS